MEKHTWLVSCCGSLWDNAVTERVIGTKEEIRKYLLDLVTEEREEKEKDDGDETWDYGAETLDDVYEVNDPPPSFRSEAGLRAAYADTGHTHARCPV